MNRPEKKAGSQPVHELRAPGTAPDVLQRLALAKAREGRMDEAIPLFEQALEGCRDGKDADMRLGLLNNLGYALRLVGDTQEAETQLKTALQLVGPDSHSSMARLVLANLARTYVDELRYEDAAATFLELVQRCSEANEPGEEALARLDAANSLLNVLSTEPKPIPEAKKVAKRAMETLAPKLNLLKDKNLEKGIQFLAECKNILNMEERPSIDPDGDSVG